MCLLLHYESSKTFAKTMIFAAIAQLKINVSPVSRTKGPEKDASADAEVEANVANVTFCSVTVAEAELSVILHNTTIDPVWLLYKLMSLTMATVAAGQV